MVFTESVRSRQVPATPRTSAWPPSLPSVPTSRATRVTSSANEESWSTIVFTVRPMRRNSPRSGRPSISSAMCWDRSPSATATMTRAISVVGRPRSSMSLLTARTPSAQAPSKPSSSSRSVTRPSRPTTRLIRMQLPVLPLLQRDHLVEGVGDLAGRPVAPRQAHLDVAATDPPQRPASSPSSAESSRVRRRRSSLSPWSWCPHSLSTGEGPSSWPRPTVSLRGPALCNHPRSLEDASRVSRGRAGRRAPKQASWYVACGFRTTDAHRRRPVPSSGPCSRRRDSAPSAERGAAADHRIVHQRGGSRRNAELDIEVTADPAGITVTVTDFAPGPVDELAVTPRNEETQIARWPNAGVACCSSTTSPAVGAPCTRAPARAFGSGLSAARPRPAGDTAAELPLEGPPSPDGPSVGALTTLLRMAPERHAEDGLADFAGDLLSRGSPGSPGPRAHWFTWIAATAVGVSNSPGTVSRAA